MKCLWRSAELSCICYRCTSPTTQVVDGHNLLEISLETGSIRMRERKITHIHFLRGIDIMASACRPLWFGKNWTFRARQQCRK